MKRLPLLVLLAFSAHLPLAVAGPATDTLSKCLSENTTGKERKDLARWIFVAISTHPELKQLSSTTAADLDQTSRMTAGLFTKLLTENCLGQVKSAIQAEGAQSLQAAFSVLGQVAMQELMSDGGVNAAIGAFERHMDMKKIEAAIGAK